MSISIVIPCYEMKGAGNKYLDQLLSTIEAQTHKSKIEIVISDDSESTMIEEVAAKYKHLHVVYCKNESNIKGLGINTNNGIRYSTNNQIKILYQDDFFVRQDAISILLKHKQHDWSASSFIHYNENIRSFGHTQTPFYNTKIIDGVNTIGSPSVISFSKNLGESFDSTMNWFVDCEFYYRLKQKTELNVIPEILVGIRLHDKQTTNHITMELVEREKLHINNKHRLLQN